MVIKVLESVKNTWQTFQVADFYLINLIRYCQLYTCAWKYLFEVNSENLISDVFKEYKKVNTGLKYAVTVPMLLWRVFDF